MIKRLPNGSRGEETVNNKTQTQGKSFLFPFVYKKYVSMIFFWLSTSQLPWATFAASLNPHFGQKTKLSCSCCPHVEQNMASKEEGGAGNRSFFSANTWGPGANVL